MTVTGLGGLTVVEVDYRRLVLEFSDLPQVWTDPALLTVAAQCWCGDRWRECGTPDVCLAVALLLDDPEPWRAGHSRVERLEVWRDLEDLAIGLDPWIGQHA